MNDPRIGTLFSEYRQYVALMDEALAACDQPLMNGLPLADDARRQIADGRLSFDKQTDCLLLFSAHQGYAKLYYIAAPDAALRIPRTNSPIVADQIRRGDRAYALYDALMLRGGLALRRINIGMERSLDSPVHPEAYLGAAENDTPVDFAAPADLEAVQRILADNFDPVLDELPTEDMLSEYIHNQWVSVVREAGRPISIMIRIPRGGSEMLRWIATDAAYRSRRLSGVMHLAGDLRARQAGRRQTALWINADAQRWIQSHRKRGYELSNRYLYTFVRPPEA